MREFFSPFLNFLLEDPHEKHSRVTEAFLCKHLYYYYHSYNVHSHFIIAVPTDTTFEDDWGAWKPRSGNKCNWRRGRSRGKKQLTGPQVDHTTGTGKFKLSN